MGAGGLRRFWLVEPVAVPSSWTPREMEMAWAETCGVETRSRAAWAATAKRSADAVLVFIVLIQGSEQVTGGHGNLGGVLGEIIGRGVVVADAAGEGEAVEEGAGEAELGEEGAVG